MGIGAAYSLLGAGTQRGWQIGQIALFSLGAIGDGIYGLTHSFQTLGLSPTGQELLGETSVRASTAAGYASSSRAHHRV
jgi:hypothetical protein